jgi:phosphopantetheinyl transferase
VGVPDSPPGPGLALPPDEVREVLGAFVLAEAREPGEVAVPLGPGERALLDAMPWPLRRAEWLAGRRVAKRLLSAAWSLDPSRVEVLPLESGAPRVWVDGAAREDLVLNLSHTRGWVAAALATVPVGVDVCDDADGHRLERIGRRVFSEGEAEGCGAHASPQHQAAVWALKEAGLKLRIGGVFDPGAKSVRVEALQPARVADRTMRVALLRLPSAAVAVAVEAASLR